MEAWAKSRHQAVIRCRAKPSYVASPMYVAYLNVENHAKMTSMTRGVGCRASSGGYDLRAETMRDRVVPPRVQLLSEAYNALRMGSAAAVTAGWSEPKRKPQP